MASEPSRSREVGKRMSLTRSSVKVDMGAFYPAVGQSPQSSDVGSDDTALRWDAQSAVRLPARSATVVVGSLGVPWRRALTACCPGAGDAPGQPGSPPSGAEGRGRTYGPTAEGSQVLSAGKTVSSSNTSSIGTKKGSTPLMTRVTGICVTEDRTNSTSPTGGVSSPIIRLKMTITAKWVPSMPKMSAIGASTG